MSKFIEMIGQYCFGSIGKRIKNLAVIITVSGMISGIIVGISMIVNDMVPEGILIMFAGFTVLPIALYLLYGFGQLIENTTEIAECVYYKTYPEDAETESNSTKEASFVDKFSGEDSMPLRKTAKGGWTCCHCGTMNNPNEQYCRDCGEYK